MKEAITKGNQKSQSQSRSRARARDILGKKKWPGSSTLHWTKEILLEKQTPL